MVMCISFRMIWNFENVGFMFMQHHRGYVRPSNSKLEASFIESPCLVLSFN